MKITKTQLKQIIKEEMKKVLNENMACEELTKELAGYYQQQNAIVSQLGMQAQGDPAYEDLDRSIASVSQRAREAGCNNAEMSLKAKSMAEKG